MNSYKKTIILLAFLASQSWAALPYKLHTKTLDAHSAKSENEKNKKEAMELSKKGALTLSQKGLSIDSEQNIGIMKLFLSHPALENKDLRNIIFSYHGTEWLRYKVLTAPEISSPCLLEQLQFTDNDTTLHANQLLNHDSEKRIKFGQQAGVLEWNISSGKCVKDTLDEIQQGPFFGQRALEDPTYILPTATTQDEYMKAFYVIPGMSDYKNGLLNDFPMRILLACNKIALLNRMIKFAPSYVHNNHKRMSHRGCLIL